jgi:nucleotide-binding universal stress UspA family protein
MKNILVATDFSKQAHHAFEAALQLARRAGGAVTLLHVVDAPEPATAGFSTYGGPVNSDQPTPAAGMDELFTLKRLEATRQRMQRLQAEAAHLAPGVPVHDTAAVAEFPEAVARLIQERQIDLLVVGPQEHDTLERFFASTHTEQLIRQATCPVLAVKHAPGEFELRTMVFAVDFAAEADAAVPGRRQLLQLYPAARLLLLHVVNDEFERPDLLARLQEFALRHQLPQAEPVLFEAGRPTRGIQQFAWQQQADLVILPTRGRSAFSRLFVGSVAEAVATEAACPVLTFHV